MSAHARRGRGRITLAVVLLLPLAVGLALLGSLDGRLDRVDEVPAAVVNADQIVTTGEGADAQTVAAGRLLAANLTNPPAGTDVGFAWELTDADDAATGLASGGYAAVVTIPEDFSAAVSSASTDDPVAATIQVQGDDARSAVAALLAEQVATAAAGAMGQQITSTYLDDVYLGFNQIADQMDQAADGAQQAASGATSLADGTGQLAGGAGALASGTAEVARGADSLAGGAGALSGGAARVASGATALAGATNQVASGAGEVNAGAADLAAALDAIDQRVHDLPPAAAALGEDAAALDALAGTLATLAADCAAGTAGACTALQAAAAPDGALRSLASGIGSRADGLAAAGGGVVAGLDQLTAAADAVAGGSAQVAVGAGQVAAGAATLASGASGVADGAAELSTGASGLAQGAGETSAGAAEVAGGARSAAAGAASLAGGVGELAGGLTSGAGQVPTYDDDQRDTLASVVSAPVVAEDTTVPLADQDAIAGPLVVPAAVWLGALAAFLVLPAVPRRAAYEPAGVLRVAVRAWLPAVAVAAVQALVLVLAVPLLGVGARNPVGAALFALAAAAVFAAVNQGLVALWGRAGLVVSLAFLALQVACVGVLIPLQTAPPVFRELSGLLPLPQAAEALGVLVLGLEGSWIQPLVGLLLWGVAGLAAAALVVRRARARVPRRDLAAARLVDGTRHDVARAA
jgi:putative membrane protein